MENRDGQKRKDLLERGRATLEHVVQKRKRKAELQMAVSEDKEKGSM